MIVTILIRGERCILKNAKSKPHQKIFEIDYLQIVARKSGFSEFQYQAFGCLIMFTVKKQKHIHLSALKSCCLAGACFRNEQLSGCISS